MKVRFAVVELLPSVDVYHDGMYSVLRLKVVFAVAVLGLMFAQGCHRASKGGLATDSKATTAKAATKHFHLRGKVMAIDPTKGEVVLDHEAIPGLMGAMMMPYKLVEPNLLSELHPGDVLTADLLVDPISDDPAGGYRNARLDDLVVVGQAKPDYKPPVQYHVPTAGDEVPNFALLNQSDKTIHLKQFRGQVVLMTFIYTRCQLAEFCPRMSRNFAEIDKQLALDPALYAATHLISVSFDPTYDTPSVLKSYGGAYTGRYTHEEFKHWDFAAPPVKELPAITQYFDVGVTPGQSKTLTHSLSTILIGQDGRVLQWYPTNEWQVADALAAIRKAAGK